jgi:hypothetical protein
MANIGPQYGRKEAVALLKKRLSDARKQYSILTVDPWLHYMSAKLDYLSAKKDADEIYMQDLTDAIAQFQAGNTKIKMPPDPSKRKKRGF